MSSPSADKKFVTLGILYFMKYNQNDFVYAKVMFYRLISLIYQFDAYAIICHGTVPVF